MKQTKRRIIMTREELMGLIHGIRDNYKDGENLSKDDLYKIGLAHRHLPKGERSWSWLLSLTGGFSSSEAYRNFVLNRLKKNNFVEDAISSEGEAQLDDYTVQKNELFKERQKLRDERTTINRLLRDEARVERFLEELKEEARKYKPLPEVRYQGKADGNIEAVALLSDLHLGMLIDEYCNKYNLKIAQKRLDKWTEDVIRYCKANKVKRLTVVNLGDMIAGDIHPTIRVEQEVDVISQIINAEEMLARVLNRLQEGAPEVIYRSVSDNHARLLPNKSESIERENFFRLIDNWLEVRLENTKIKMPKDNVSFRTGKFRLMNGKLCMFEHGHCLKPNSAFQDLIGMTEEYVHYVFIAHYHSEKMKTFQNMRVYVNGSICGTDPYADSIHKYSKPKQTMLIFDGDNVINFSIDLDIRD